MQIGPYSILDELGRGGVGVVYRARGADGSVVALKLLKPEQALRPQARARFQREVDALRGLRHPGVVPLVDAGEHRGAPWVALELVEGESLERRLAQGPLPLDEALRLTRQLAQALAHVHARGLLHRDLKPDNVLLRGEQALLTDFGLALEFDGKATRLTQSGAFLGTPGYWAPEQARGQLDALGPATDLYGLGAVLYACLCGRPPVLGTSLQQCMATVEFERIPPPRRLRPEVPVWLSQLCMRCLAFDTARRPASAAALAAALDAERDAPAAGPPLRALAVLAVVAALVVTSALTWLLVRGQAPEPAGPTPAAEERTEDPADDGPGDSPALHAEPDRAPAFALEGWPSGEVAERVVLYEPWSFSRTAAGELAFRGIGLSRPELALPLRLDGGPWEVRATFSDLRLINPGWVGLMLVPEFSRESAADMSAAPAMGWALRQGDDYGLALHALLRGRGASPERLPLEIDPRGPLTVALAWTPPELTLSAWDPEGHTHSLRLTPSRGLPKLAMLRLGQTFPAVPPSRGELAGWTAGRCQGRLRRLVAWGPGLALGELPDETYWEQGRLGWLLHTAEREALEAKIQPYTMSTRGYAQRLSLYVRALALARDGEVELATETLLGLDAISANVGVPPRGPDDSRFFLRNRVQCDLWSYSPELRAALATRWSGAGELAQALSRAQDLSNAYDPARFSSVAHERGWAWCQLLLHLANGAELEGVAPAKLYAGAAFFDEAWASVERGESGVGPRVEGWVAFFEGHFAEADRRWRALPAGKPELERARACARKWAGR